MEEMQGENSLLTRINTEDFGYLGGDAMKYFRRYLAAMALLLLGSILSACSSEQLLRLSFGSAERGANNQQIICNNTATSLTYRLYHQGGPLSWMHRLSTPDGHIIKELSLDSSHPDVRLGQEASESFVSYDILLTAADVTNLETDLSTISLILSLFENGGPPLSSLEGQLVIAECLNVKNFRFESDFGNAFAGYFICQSKPTQLDYSFELAGDATEFLEGYQLSLRSFSGSKEVLKQDLRLADVRFSRTQDAEGLKSLIEYRLEIAAGLAPLDEGTTTTVLELNLQAKNGHVNTQRLGIAVLDQVSTCS
ncbi:MAG: hypothetical protein R2880_03610 [Deinococcales bacterium]